MLHSKNQKRRFTDVKNQFAEFSFAVQGSYNSFAKKGKCQTKVIIFVHGGRDIF